MNYHEYREMIKSVPYSENIEYKLAIMWLHPEHLPVGVLSVGDDAEGIIKIPHAAVNRYGKKVPVIAIGKNAFSCHDKISDIVLPSGIQRIDAGAFAGCSGLKRITLPKSVKQIREGTFADCDALEDIYFEGTPEEWQKIDIVHHKREIEFGGLLPGTPVQEVKAERLVHIPGNDALFTANLHFHCTLPDSENDPTYEIKAKARKVTVCSDYPQANRLLVASPIDNHADNRE